jgi:hypothetical protein
MNVNYLRVTDVKSWILTGILNYPSDFLSLKQNAQYVLVLTLVVYLYLYF